MPLDGLRWGRDSGSAHCNMPRKCRSRTAWGGRILFVRYMTDFDCKEETSFWSIIKESPFVFDDLSKKYRKAVLKALERCEVKRIDPSQYANEIYNCYEKAFENYENAGEKSSRESFVSGLAKSTHEWWAAFCKDTGEMAGWMSCRNNGDWTETISAKYNPELQSYRPSDAIHFTILNHYLNELGQRYINSGSRNINHKTNVQDYKEKNWKFRRAYCKLRIVYNPKIAWIIKAIYPFRCLLRLLDSITIVHQVNSLLRMEEIVRECR